MTDGEGGNVLQMLSELARRLGPAASAAIAVLLIVLGILIIVYPLLLALLAGIVLILAGIGVLAAAISAAERPRS